MQYHAFRPTDPALYSTKKGKDKRGSKWKTKKHGLIHCYIYRIRGGKAQIKAASTSFLMFSFLLKGVSTSF